LRIELGFASKPFFHFFFQCFFHFLFLKIYLDIDAASLFAITVLLSDQFLDFKHN